MDDRDFFISYNSADQEWAEWIAWQLEAEGYSVTIQSWDSRPGMNPVLQMDRGLHADRTLLVLSPHSLDSQFVRLEWSAVLARDPEGWGRRLIPVRVAPCEPHGLLGTRIYIDLVGVDNAEEARRLLLQGLQPRDKPIREPGYPGHAGPVFPGAVLSHDDSEVESGILPIPDPPPHFLPRPEYVDPLKRALRVAAGKAVGVIGMTKVGLQGMGGIGKTVLAAAVARDADVQARFADGVIWVTIGQYPDIVAMQTELLAELGGPEIKLRSAQHGKRVLKKLLAEQAILLVLDDVWTLRHAAMLDVVGSAGQLLLTSRDRQVLVSLGADEHEIGLLTPEQSRVLLASWAGMAVDELPAIADPIVAECGYLPLALSMVGAMLRLEPDAWEDILERLRTASLDKIHQQFPNYPYPSLLRTIEVSVGALDPATRQAYLELAIFPDDTEIPLVALETLWSDRREPADVRALLTQLATRSLLRWDKGRVTLHDLQRDYVQLRTADDARRIHLELVDAYRRRCPRGFALCADDGYLYRRLAYHLVRAGALEPVRALLIDARWLMAKLRATNLSTLLADYDELPAGDELRRIRACLQLASEVLIQAPEQLASQIHGRLDAPAALLTSLRTAMKGRTWLRPLHPSLEPPGRGLVATLHGHHARITRLTVLDNGRIASASADGTVAIWDLNVANIVKTLDGHTDWVRDVQSLGDGRVLTASDDYTVRMWDGETGDFLRVFVGHTDRVRAVASWGEGRFVSASDDRTVRCWDADADSTDPIAVLDGHGDRVFAVAILDSGEILSAAGDGKLYRWDAATGTLLDVIEAHDGAVRALCVHHDRLVISASAAGTVRAWDLVDNRLLTTFEGHASEVHGISMLDADHVLSASWDGTVRLWDLHTASTLTMLTGHLAAVEDVVVAGELVVSAAWDGSIRLWNLRDGAAATRSDRHIAPVRSVTVLDNGHVVSAADDATMRVWDPESGECLRVLRGHEQPVRQVRKLDARRVVSSAGDGTVRVWDTHTGEELQRIDAHPRWVLGVAVIDRHRVVSAAGDHTLCVWDLETGACLGRLEGHTDRVRDAAVLDSDTIVSASSDRTLRVWDLATWKEKAVLGGHDDWVRGVVTLANGRIVSASGDHTLRVWDPGSAKTLAVLRGHRDGLTGVASLGNDRVASVSFDRTLRLWDLTSGSTLASFHADTPLRSIAATERFLAAGDDIGNLHFLTVETPSDR
ncbi:MAG: TIR domain-containing protein [Acidobacteriota bacterium]